MKKLIVTSIYLTLTSLFMLSQEPKLHIYRNDNGFSTVPLSEGTVINHSVNGDETFMTILDGESSISLPTSKIDSLVVKPIEIPTLSFYLTDYPEATQLWDKEMYLNVTLDISGNGYCEDAIGLTLSIKGRGNSTWRMPKKPYRLKFNKKTSICGFKKAKSYVLLANFIDNTLMKNVITLWIANKLGMAYANTTIPCNVLLNGHPQGSYLLTEKIGINSGSVDIDESTGILFELSTEFDEQYKFMSPGLNLPVMVKDPDFEELAADTPEGPDAMQRFEIWRQDFIAAERMAMTGHGFEAFDLQSFVDFFLLNNIAYNNEIGYPKSVYIYKESVGTENKYKFGPPWDFDVCYNLLKLDPADGEYTAPDKELWVNALFATLMDHPEFKAAYQTRFEYFEKNIYPELLKFIDEYAALIEPSAKANGVIWPESGIYDSWARYRSSYDTKTNTAALRTWIEERIAFLKSQL